MLIGPATGFGSALGTECAKFIVSSLREKSKRKSETSAVLSEV
jgi:hypothetical protein